GGTVGRVGLSKFPAGITNSEERTSTDLRFNGLTAAGNSDMVWTKTMDINGDGKVDIITASEVPHAWVIYLNNGSLDATTWPPRTYATDTLAQYLRDRGLPVDANYLPLEQRRTSGLGLTIKCWLYDGVDWSLTTDPQDLAACGGFTGPH